MLLQKDGKKVIDLTPAAIGPFTIPVINGDANIDEPNVNMVTCGGQATIPIVNAVRRASKRVVWGEIVASISSKSAGPGTRANIDEFTETTRHAIEVLGGAERGKAIIILNPAEPPLIMRDTVHCLTEGEPQQDAIRESIADMIKEVQKYVPGYSLVNGPVFDGNRVSVYLEVEGLGDYLPKYAGNLDIMTAAAARTAEMFAEEILAGSLTLAPSAA
jgi:acetaldehyde/propanal dehydrogenase